MPNFDEKPGEESSKHIMTYHLFYSSKSLMDHSIRLRLFYRSLMGGATKWHIKPKGISFEILNNLAFFFLTQFQIPIRYEIEIEILRSPFHDISTYISNHIHKWRKWCRMVKANIPDQLLMEWFTKSLFPPISKDVSMEGETIEDQAIMCAQILYLIYSQFNTL